MFQSLLEHLLSRPSETAEDMEIEGFSTPPARECSARLMLSFPSARMLTIRIDF